MIDYWCNAFTPDRKPKWRQVIEADGLTIKLGARDGDAFCTVEEMVTRMDDCGVTTLVLPVCDLDDDAPLDEFPHYALRPFEIEAMAAAHPDRFVGMFSITPDDDDDLAAATRALAQPWCVGLHNHTHSWPHRFDAPVFDPYYTLARDADVPFVMQAGASGGHRDHELGHPLGIDGPARRFPTVRFVLSHLGLPWLDDTLSMALEHANVVIGTATHPPRRWPPALLGFLRGPSAEDVLFGTGYPLTGHRHVLAQLHELDLPAASIDALRTDNARRIFTRLDES